VYISKYVDGRNNNNDSFFLISYIIQIVWFEFGMEFEMIIKNWMEMALDLFVFVVVIFFTVIVCWPLLSSV